MTSNRNIILNSDSFFFLFRIPYENTLEHLNSHMQSIVSKHGGACNNLLTFYVEPNQHFKPVVNVICVHCDYYETVIEWWLLCDRSRATGWLLLGKEEKINYTIRNRCERMGLKKKKMYLTIINDYFVMNISRYSFSFKCIRSSIILEVKNRGDSYSCYLIVDKCIRIPKLKLLAWLDDNWELFLDGNTEFFQAT